MEWQSLLATIRAKPGFERFGLPPTAAQLRAAAGEGVIVAVNVTEIECGALLLDSGGMDYLPLPLLTQADAITQTNRYLAAVYRFDDPGAPVDTTAMLDVLGWLWDAVAGPVLAHLGHIRTPKAKQDWPHVWWLPTGVLSLLPIHAAGHHDDPDTRERRAVLDRVISSYTPTAGILYQARRPVATSNGQALVVGIDNAPGQNPLLFAEAEATAVHHILNRPGPPPLLGQAATRDNVGKALHSAGWTHLACHAVADHDDPARSHLALYDGPLEVRELGQLPRIDAHLAYLSACTTATSATRLLDEPIHLASAFLLAGYQHAIGTLWPINDALARRIAERVYQQLAAGTAPAIALHQTIRRLRANPDVAARPHLWASHIHFGP
jgi:hypothetical protein